MADGKKNPLGPTGERVQANVAQLRVLRGLKYRELADRLDAIGRPIPVLGLSRIERGERRVDADDLVALAIALGVTPDRLLLPVEDTENDVELTPAVVAKPWQAWAWAQGRSPLLAALAALDPDQPAGDLWLLLDDFKRHSLPPTELRRESHTAVKAARDLLDRVIGMLDWQDERDRTVARLPGQDPDPKGVLPKYAAGLRRAVTRTAAEVDDVIGDVDGDR